MTRDLQLNFNIPADDAWRIPDDPFEDSVWRAVEAWANPFLPPPWVHYHDGIRATLWRRLLRQQYRMWRDLPDPPKINDLRPGYTVEDAIPLDVLRSRTIPRYPTIV